MQTREWLTRTLAVAPALHRARLYLGHILYDEADYDLALLHLEQIPPRAFAAEGQSWRDAKRAELILAARAYLGRVGELAIAGQELVASYRAMPREERPVPTDLSACVRSLRVSSGALARPLGDVLVEVRRLTDLDAWEALHLVDPS
ncbi:MAG: hypothetical protein U1E65_31230 [Myxococcota bacterium]